MRSLVLSLALIGLADTAFAAAEADLLLAYDSSYSDSVGSDANAQVLAINAVAGSNAINERSGTGARIRICGYHKTTGQAGTTSLSGFVARMWTYGDGLLDDVTTAADARGADLVAYICQPAAGEGAAAVAHQPGRYAAYGPGHFWTNVVAHETGGHNYGCDHRGGKLSPKTVLLHNYCGGGSSPWFSNPNIWINGVRLQGDGSCVGEAVANGDNATVVSNAAQGVADRNNRVAVAPKLGSVVRRWLFNQSAGGAPAGTTIADQVSGSALATVQGSGATFTGKGLRIPGGASGSGAAYLQLPSGLISGYTNATVEIWATPLSAQNWARVADFNNGTANYVTLMSSRGTNLDTQRLEAKVGGVTATRDSSLPTVAGVPHHYAITFVDNGAGGGRWTWFRDGDEIGYLDVTHTLSALQDVNNWLGRSAYSGDAFAHCEYSEVRVSNVAMSRDEVLANFSLGPNRQAAGVNLTAADPLNQSSFNAAGRWSDGLAPNSGKSYETYNFRLRTPANGSSHTFAGQSLTLTGGSFTWKGTGSSTITVNNLSLNGDCEVLNAGSGTFTLAGNATVKSEDTLIRAGSGPINLSASLGGDGDILCTDNTVTLGGNNASFAGKIVVGGGRTGTLAIDSEVRLGANPATPVSDHLTLDRGTLRTSGTFAIDDPNRGILLGINGGSIDVASGTLTLASPLSSPNLGSGVTAGNLRKSGAGTLVLASASSGFNGEVYLDTGSSSSSDGAMRVTNSETLAGARSPFYMNNNNGGRSTLQLDGTSGDIVLWQRLSLAGRNNTTPAVQNLAGSNSLGGIDLSSGGSDYRVQSDAGLLDLKGSVAAGVTGTRPLTLQGSGNGQVSGRIENGSADAVNLTKSGTGAWTLNSANTYTGTTTVAQGELVVKGATGSGATTVSSGATLGGGGLVSAALTAETGATVRVGASGFPVAQTIAKLDDFDSYPTGSTTAATGGVWNGEFVGTGNSNIVASDGGRALQTKGGVAWRGGKTDLTHWNAGIGLGETATIFFQMKAVGSGTYSIMTGLSPSVSNIDITDAWADFAVMPYLDGVAGSTLAYRMNDAGLTDKVIFNMNTDVWYNVWLVIDNASETYSVYYSTGTNNGVFGGTATKYWQGHTNTVLNALGFMASGSSTTSLLVDNVHRLHGVNTSYPLGLTGEPISVSETLTVGGDFALAAGSTLELDVATGPVHDKLVVGGHFTANGTLKVALDPALPSLVAGDTFDLFDAATANIAFSDLVLPALSPGLEWDTSAIGTGVLSVIDTAEGYLAWAQGYIFPPGTDAPSADANDNGMANVFEWLFGSDPVASGPASPAWPRVGLQSVTGSEFPGADPSKRYLSLTATVRKGISGWTLVAQAAGSPALLNEPGSSDDIVSMMLNDVGDFEERRWIHTVPIGDAGAGFMRLKLTDEEVKEGR